METKTIKITSKPKVKELLRLELDFKPRVNGPIIKIYGDALTKSIVTMLNKEGIMTEVSTVKEDKFSIRVLNALLAVQDNVLIFNELLRNYDVADN